MRHYVLLVLCLMPIGVQADQYNPDLACNCGKTQRDHMTNNILLNNAQQAHQEIPSPDLACATCNKTQRDHLAQSVTADHKSGIPIMVTAADIAPGGVAGMYTITQPGCYVLSEDVFVNAFSDLYTITIDANDVIFDLNGKSIIRSNGFGGCFAANNNNHITIKNGSISQFNNGPLHFMACEHVMLDQLEVLKSEGSVAAFFNSCINCSVTHCTFNNGSFNPTGVVTIIGFVSTYAPSGNHIIENCSINYNTTSTASLVIGILMGDSPFSTIKNCHINNNHITKAHMQAIYLNRSTHCSIQQCEVANNTCVNGFFDGMFVNLTHNSTIEQCSVTYNRSVFGPVNCVFLNKCSNCLVQDCNINGNLIISHLSNHTMTGIRLGSFSGPNKLVCTSCLVNHNLVNENRTYGSGISRGIHALDDGTSSNAITNNTVTRNTSTTTSIGIDLDGGTNASGNIVSGHLIN